MRSLRPLLTTSIALLALAAPTLSAASPSFPEAIKGDLMLTYSLGTAACLGSTDPTCHCTICHMTNSGGVGTVVKPFGIAMKAAGLTLENTDSLSKALMTLDTNMTDSDCNMIPDIEQLKMGMDPSTGQVISMGATQGMPDTGCSTTAGGPMPVYGCGAQLARVPASWPGAAALVTALGLVLAARRRRR